MRVEYFASRVGGWVVALGIGVAIASAPGVAWAESDVGGTTAADSTSAIGRAGPATGEKSSSTSRNARDADKDTTADSDTGTRSKTTVGSRGSPARPVSGTTAGTDGQDVLDDTDPTPAVDQPVDTVAPPQLAGTPATGEAESPSTAATFDHAVTSPVVEESPTHGTEQSEAKSVTGGVAGIAPDAQDATTIPAVAVESASDATTVPTAAAAVLPTKVLTVAGAFSSSGQVPPQLQGKITAGNTVVPVLYRNSDPLGWLFGDGTRPEYIADGVQKLNAAINTTPGPKVVLGQSLGAVVAQYWLAQYGPTSTIPANELRFVLIGNSIRKYGGRIRSQPAHLAVANAVQVPGIRYQVLDIARQWDIHADHPLTTTSQYHSAALNNVKAGDRPPYTLHANYKNVDPDPDAPGNTKLVEGNWTYVWSRTNDIPLFYSSWNRLVYGVSGMTAAQRDQLWRPRIESAHIRPKPIP